MQKIKKPKPVKGNICLSGYVEIPELRYSAVIGALDKHIALTRAEAGCIYFSVERSKTDMYRLEVDEIFADSAAFDYHQRRTEMSAWAEITKGIKRQFEVREIV
ncbi:MAG: antibiotic biosynthesis monooxygenase [Ahrensia sp.]|nr:antibiotic biosynthesis monooxygenase [Ahrensia sp.]